MAPLLDSTSQYHDSLCSVLHLPSPRNCASTSNLSIDPSSHGVKYILDQQTSREAKPHCMAGVQVFGSPGMFIISCLGISGPAASIMSCNQTFLGWTRTRARDGKGMYIRLCRWIGNMDVVRYASCWMTVLRVICICAWGFGRSSFCPMRIVDGDTYVGREEMLRGVRPRVCAIPYGWTVFRERNRVSLL